MLPAEPARALTENSRVIERDRFPTTSGWGRTFGPILSLWRDVSGLI